MTRCCSLVASVLAACALFAVPAYAGEEMVPDVVGMQITEAKALLEEAGFEATIQSVPGKPIGLVTSQEPGGLATRDTSIPVTLQVGGPTPKPGPGPAAPEPRDTPPADTTPPTDTTPPAGTRPADAPPTGRGTSPIDAPPAGRVDGPPAGGTAGTRPAAARDAFMWNGRPIPAGRMANTNGPALPGVLGQTSVQAQRALSRYRVKVEQTNAMAELVGQVLNQWPYAGSKLAPGEEVTIVVGVARPPNSGQLGVPQVQDHPWREACRAIERAGFKTELSVIPSPESKRGRIVAQSPLPGSLLGRGQVMRLQIGSGSDTYTPGAAAQDQPVRDPAPRDPAPRDPAPRDPAPRDPAPPAGTGPGDAPPAGTPGSPLGTPPAGTPPGGRAPVETPPMQKPPVDTRPVDTPPVQKPPRDPQPARSLSAPALREPPAGESYPYRYGANFSWTAISGAKTYELEMQEELPSGAWKNLVTHTVTGTKFRPARLERGRYRWRVRAVGAGIQGKWSEFRRLYMY